MTRAKVLIYILVFFVVSLKGFSQIDTVTFRFIPAAASFEVKCQAQKIISGDTSDFVTTDTADFVFNWSGDQIPNSNGFPSTSFNFDAAGTYTFSLEVTEKTSGDNYIETKTFEIRDVLRIPNVFTPNNDGVNDLFIVRSNGIVPLEISIYSRTGTLVFKSKAPIIVWDGRNTSGSIVSPGVYYYVLTSDDPAVETQNGFIHVYSDSKKYN